MKNDEGKEEDDDDHGFGLSRSRVSTGRPVGSNRRRNTLQTWRVRFTAYTTYVVVVVVVVHPAPGNVE